MSDEAAVATNEPQASESVQETKPSSTTALFQGNDTSTPFDAFYSEGALEKVPDGPFKSFIAKYENGAKASEGFANLNKLASSKGFERPGEGATEEEMQAFSQKLRELNGVPSSPEEYNVALPEGVELDEGLMGKLKEFGVEKGIPPAHVEALIPLQVALQQAAEEQRIQAETQKLIKAFGSEGELAAVESELKGFAKESGFDLDTPGTKSAEFWLAIKGLKAANDRIAHLTGEDKAVSGDAVNVESARSALDAFMSKDSDKYKILQNPLHPDYKATMKQFDELTMKAAQRRAR